MQTGETGTGSMGRRGASLTIIYCLFARKPQKISPCRRVVSCSVVGLVVSRVKVDIHYLPSRGHNGCRLFNNPLCLGRRRLLTIPRHNQVGIAAFSLTAPPSTPRTSTILKGGARSNGAPANHSLANKEVGPFITLLLLVVRHVPRPIEYFSLVQARSQ
jgi:hypothetical protein